ncbi:prenyltransferase/squalene oxidase repeat-containing protein [Umezawaea sp. Da 62-37]|uniref:prenyltransferase/squalene oxidase repeat-containing protein n=1 Tax=Umezawaea sp. Da 62-37 TaxID=3075927 RepID=UPI0028F7480B|nr:prenyltransferase/squalene oxidase repeat-containing protein [Umezawaea sp. Da 62-37]WNV88034.1 prenyltransferase/squalene oxidase repeat-containing protein [Umezawaea sp. Da 62-37]
MGAALSRRLSAVLGVVAMVSTGFLVLAQPAGAAKSAEAAKAASWLAGDLVDGALPGFAGPDWGLTIDGLFALSATNADQGALTAVTNAVAAHVRNYNSYDDFGVPDVRIAGATAKLLVAAVATGSDPTKFGGYDLREETLDLVSAEGDNAGRVRDKGVATDSSNTFAQSLAVVGLARTGDVPQNVVDFLLRQQCAEGGFRLSPDQFGTPAATCDQATNPVLDPDSTGMAVQALLAADEAGVEGAKAAADKGAAWLAKIQRADGSFGGSGPTDPSNTNSTGLAGQALAAAGLDADADEAAAYLAKHQLTTDNAGEASAEVGAIAYNDDAFDEAVAGGIPEFSRDQWRRASAQAALGLAMVPFGDLGEKTDPPSSSSSTTTTTTTTTTTSPTTTTTAETTTESTTETTEETTTTDTIPETADDDSGTTGTGLAHTGAPLTGLTTLAVLLIALGALVWFTDRRRVVGPPR